MAKFTCRRVKKARSYRSTCPRRPFPEAARLRKGRVQLKEGNSAPATVNSEQTNHVSYLEITIVAAICPHHYTCLCSLPPRDAASNKQVMAEKRGGCNPGGHSSDSWSSHLVRKHAGRWRQAGQDQHAKPRCMDKRLGQDQDGLKPRTSEMSDSTDCEPMRNDRRRVRHRDCAARTRTKHTPVTCGLVDCHTCRRRWCFHSPALAHLKTLLQYLIVAMETLR